MERRKFVFCFCQYCSFIFCVCSSNEKETKEVEIRDDSTDLVPKTNSNEDSHRSDDQKLQDNAQQTTNPSRNLISRFENNSNSITKDNNPNLNIAQRNNRSLSQDPTKKPVTATSSLPITSSNNLINGMATSTPFAVKKDSKENSILSQTNTNDSIAIKRVNFLFFLFLFSIEFEI